eukprot:CAMPEP_0184871604 /NCGR_PEP_ID=MMETSP0580-20130426/40817_1 /TAXON_ID=1118495 /ORGANISM="Dactyliosolen fragilissimus" /LENGTH=630 /DNA_ID=CAMNT_0027374289 /DNA_START=220 /DNA_END=2112 /DNA_ORIENTATION=+
MNISMSSLGKALVIFCYIASVLCKSKCEVTSKAISRAMEMAKIQLIKRNANKRKICKYVDKNKQVCENNSLFKNTCRKECGNKSIDLSIISVNICKDASGKVWKNTGAKCKDMIPTSKACQMKDSNAQQKCPEACELKHCKNDCPGKTKKLKILVDIRKTLLKQNKSTIKGVCDLVKKNFHVCKKGTFQTTCPDLECSSLKPTESPSYKPSTSPSLQPSVSPRYKPSTSPSLQPSKAIVVWTQLGSDINGDAYNDLFGYSVSISNDGNIVAIGVVSMDSNGLHSGSVKVYKIVSNAWTQLGSDIDGEAASDESGMSVSLSADGGTVAIGATGNDGNGYNSGHVRVYKIDADEWTQLGSDIDGEAAGDKSGMSVSLSADGETVAIGSKYNGDVGLNSGHVRVYKILADAWTQLGSDINGAVSGEQSGGSVSISANGGTVAIGAEYSDGNGRNSGHVRVYKIVADVWTQLGSDIDGETNDRSGKSVSISADGETVAIGAYNSHGNGYYNGQVRVYKIVADEWTQLGSDIDGEASCDSSGKSVSISADGETVAIGATHNDGNGSNSGHVRVYKIVSDAWTQLGSDIDGAVPGDESGNSVSISADGKTVAIGAAENDINGHNSGHVRLYKLSPL